MIRARNVSLLAAIGAIALLPACSDMMGGRSSSASSAAAAPAPQPVANAMVKQVQDRLQHDGYYKQGAVDGVWGSGTMNAVQAFQRDHSLAATGQLDVPTLQALNINAAYWYRNTWGAVLGGFVNNGSSDLTLYGNDGSPNTRAAWPS